MLDIPESFFKEEERCGYLVSEEMKRAWAAEMEIVDILSRWLESLGITILAEYGTLLGAVRHKGFIPWDDDMDLSLLRPDFMKMIENADSCPLPIRIMSVYSSNLFHSFKAIATNNFDTKLTWRPERARAFHGCPYIVGIDIYPLDYVPRDLGSARLQKLLYSLAYKMLYRCIDLENIHDPELSVKSDDIISFNDIRTSGAITDDQRADFLQGMDMLSDYLSRFFGSSLLIKPDEPLRHRLAVTCEKLASMYGSSDSDGLAYYPYIATDNQPAWRNKDWYDDIAVYPFEMTTVKGVSDYDDWLKGNYGSDYMTPVIGAQGHDFPFYKKQKEYFVFSGYMSSDEGKTT